MSNERPRVIQRGTLYPPAFQTNEPGTDESDKGIPPLDPVEGSNFGWECPRCGAVWAPSVVKCTCHPKSFSATSIEPTIDPIFNTINTQLQFAHWPTGGPTYFTWDPERNCYVPVLRPPK